ncbi:MAG: MATE family efflux transporter, partial [Erysipelotrichaceae bacterium]|nr:MATE family efflux transporter [Erysipelotrichaceae bacterium]
LPLWLKADESLWHDATMYFLFFSLFMIPRLLSRLCISLLQCTGNMKLPSILSVIMCFLDVVFNFFLILPSRYVLGIYVPGFGLGVLGAQLGTSFAYLAISLLLFYFAFIKEDSISLIDNEASWICEGKIIHEAVNIGLPIAMEQSAVTLAQVVGSRIVAPLGTIAIAANSFAVTAESICYMPGFGISAAATTMVGQALGADRKDYAFSFGWLTTIMGMIVMALMGMLMYFICPFVFSFMTPDLEVQKLAVDVLRIELFAEPLFAASIVATGALRGAKDTFIPGLINLLSIWGVRITLSLFLVNRIGLYGIWLAMAIELSIRGLLMLIRLYSCKQLKK